MNKFAKLFETEELGQILVVIDEGDEGDEGPEVRFSFSPPNLGVCQQALKYDGDDWDKAEDFFDSVDETVAAGIVKPTFDVITGG